jgi:hypothetical protein
MRCQNLIDELREKEKQLEKKQEVFQLYKNGLKGLESIENQYIKSNLDNKRRLIGSIFPENFQFENKKVRTADINPILDKIARFNRVNRRNKKRDKSKKEDLSRCVLKAGLEPTITKLKDLSFLTNLLENSSISLPSAPQIISGNNNLFLRIKSYNPIALFSKQLLTYY